MDYDSNEQWVADKGPIRTELDLKIWNLSKQIELYDKQIKLLEHLMKYPKDENN